jgi:hypothetical protein
MAASPGASGQVPDLSAETAGPVLTVPGAPPPFHVLAKPTGASCNLDCEYCFFLSKVMLYPGSRFRMAADLPAPVAGGPGAGTGGGRRPAGR